MSRPNNAPVVYPPPNHWHEMPTTVASRFKYFPATGNGSINNNVNNKINISRAHQNATNDSATTGNTTASPRSSLLQDANVAAIFPALMSSNNHKKNDPTHSMDRMGPAIGSRTTITRLPPDPECPAEYDPTADGALQFVPAFYQRHQPPPPQPTSSHPTSTATMEARPVLRTTHRNQNVPREGSHAGAGNTNTLQEASWDVLLEEEGHRPTSKDGKRHPATTVVIPPAPSSLASRARDYKRLRQTQMQQRRVQPQQPQQPEADDDVEAIVTRNDDDDDDDEAQQEHQQLLSPPQRLRQQQRTRPQVSPPSPPETRSEMEYPLSRSSPRGAASSTTPNGRIHRLASLFASRAAVAVGGQSTTTSVRPSPIPTNNPNNNNHSNDNSHHHRTREPPASPTTSASSTGYVGWPGTVDRTGQIVPETKSYDDTNSSGAESSYPTIRVVPSESRKQQNEPTPPQAQHQRRKSQPVDVDDIDPAAEDEDEPIGEEDDLVAPVPQNNSLSAMRYAQSDVLNYRTRLAQHRNFHQHHWRKATETSSSPGGSLTSSAYMTVDEDLVVYHMDPSYGRHHGIHPRNPPISSKEGRGRLTHERLAVADQYQPPHRTFANSQGFRALLHKNEEVPSLMDNLDSDSSSQVTSTFSKPALFHKSDNESDVFDGVSVTKESDYCFKRTDTRSQTGPSHYPSQLHAPHSYPESIAEEEVEEFKLVLLGGGLSAIQPTNVSYSQRATAVDFDENLSNSEVDQHGFARVPGVNEMISKGRKLHDHALAGIQGNLGMQRTLTMASSDEGSSLFTDPYDANSSCLEVEGDLSEYYIHPRVMKKVVRRYKLLSERLDNSMSLEEFERDDDEHKAFALFEMRSRIMEKDIERGLERRGGTVPVDDLVTTEYGKSLMRIRDACIVSKAWRDGASPMDVINAALLTRRSERTFFVKRPVWVSDSMSVWSGHSTTSPRQFTWEPRRWVDDADFTQYRCPSLGARGMRGFEMFTVGDCQSILLKLTNEQCMSLRTTLNIATQRQIEAEELLKQESDTTFPHDSMTHAEMEYLDAMEHVKTISKKLVVAEQAFALVRDRILALVGRYQSILAKIETGSLAGASSIITSSSYYSEMDSDYWEEQEHYERERWARRAKRAEIRAEIAAREAVMARQEARMIQREKQQELDALQQKLLELQSEPSTAFPSTENEHVVAIAKNYAMHRNDSPEDATTSQKEYQRNITAEEGSGVWNTGRRPGADKEKLDVVKQRFRERIAAKKRDPPSVLTASSTDHSGSSHGVINQVTPSPPAGRNLFRGAGEEMFQHLNFYERSLKAVALTRDKL